MNKGLERLSTEIDNQMNSRQTIHEQNRVKYKIDVDEEIPLPQIAWSLTNIKTEGQEILGTLGNFSLIIGKAKVKKSFFISIAISTSLISIILHESAHYLIAEYFTSLGDSRLKEEITKKIKEFVESSQFSIEDAIDSMSISDDDIMKQAEEELNNGK